MCPHTLAQIAALHDASLSHRTARPQMVSAMSALVIRVNGSRAIKDVDLAILLGISLSELYKRIGDKLWRFAPTSCCILTNQYDRGRPNAQRRLAFFRGGVIALAGTIRDDASFQIGLEVTDALRNRRRASAQNSGFLSVPTILSCRSAITRRGRACVTSWGPT